MSRRRIVGIFVMDSVHYLCITRSFGKRRDVNMDYNGWHKSMARLTPSVSLLPTIPKCSSMMAMIAIYVRGD